MNKMTDSNKKKNSRFHQVDHLDHFKIVEKSFEDEENVDNI